MMQRDKAHMVPIELLLRALSSFDGVTTANGDPAGTTLICATLIGCNDFVTSKTVLLLSGNSIYEDRAATVFGPVDGQITVSPAFSSQVLAGTSFFVLNTASAKVILALEHEVEWCTTPVCEQVASALATTLTAGSLTPTFPPWATSIRALLVATIHCANQGANTHHIGFQIQGRKGGGVWSNLLTLFAIPPLAMANVDGSGDGWIGAIDVTALVDTSGVVYDFHFIVDSDNAGAVNYTTSFALVLIYRTP